MSENLNRKRKASRDPDSKPQEEHEIFQPSETIESFAAEEPPAPVSVVKPESSALKLPVLAGLAAGLLGGVLAGVIILTTPHLNSYILGVNAPNRINSSASEKAIAERMAGLEAKLAAINASGADVSKTDMTVSSLLSRTEALEKTVSESPAINTESVARIGRLETSLGTLSKQQTGHNGAALMLAAEALKYKFERGGSFLTELKTVESWVDPAFNLSALRQYAESGLPAVQRISQRFADISPVIVKDASPAPEGLLGRVGQAASGLVKVRPSNEPYAVDVPSIVARVQASLARNDIGPALDDLAKLEEPALSKAEPVIKDLKARLDVEAAIRALEQNALQSLNLKKN